MADSYERIRAALADRYRIQREIGRGGMATVYLAEDPRHDRPVAVKVLPPDLAAVLGPERFLREIGIAARLTHPHILPLLDSGSADGLLYYVMPYIEGESLRARLGRERQLPIEEALRIAIEVAGALEYAHGKGIVHRDIKPENVLLSAGQPVVADFGIARAIHTAAGDRLTGTGVVIGTPEYMSPEQALGRADIDGRSDQYSLGCVLFEMLAGRPPFVGPAESLTAQHLNAPIPRVTLIRPTVIPPVERVLERALSKTPADRFANLAQFAETLGRAIHPPEPGPGPRPIRPSGISRWVVTRIIAPAVLLVLLLAAWNWTALPRWLGMARPAVHATRTWILVSDFEAAPGDEDLAGSVRELVSATLDQSAVVATVPIGRIREVLRTAGKPDTTHVNPELARELAYRSAVRVIVGGQLRRLGTGYSVILRVLDVERDSLLLTIHQEASSQSELIACVDGLSRKLRASLGERPNALRATRGAGLVITPSFDAYRANLKASQLAASGRDGDMRASLSLYRQALALDPDFAMAYRQMGTTFLNLGMSDSAEWAFRQASRRTGRLSEPQRLMNEADLEMARGDDAAALLAVDAVLAQDSSHLAAWNRRSFMMGDLGRFDEALRSAEEIIRRNPFGPGPIALHNLFAWYLVTGDLDRAARTFDAPRASWMSCSDRMLLAEARGDWSRAESLATGTLARPSAEASERWQALRLLAGQEGARGMISGAVKHLRMAAAIDPTAVGMSGYIPDHFEDRTQILLAHITGEALIPPPRHARGDASAALITMALRSAALGDMRNARVLLRRILVFSPDELRKHAHAVAVLEAFIAIRDGRASEVVRILQPVARLEDDPAGTRDAIGRPWPRWLMAEAWEHLGSPDSAAAYYELATSPGTSLFYEETRLISSYAHQRLVLLYSHAGQVAQAERHWRILSETMLDAEPEARALLDEARGSLATARGMARSTAR